jgi:transglutaminase-like putative cysteine protease
MGWWQETVDMGTVPPPALLKNFVKTLGPLSYAIARNPTTIAKNLDSWNERLRRSRKPWVHLEDERVYDTTRTLTEDDYRNLPPVHDEKYLRPSRLCDCDHPAVRAVAKKLGAYEKDLDDYAQSIFYFVKNQKFLQMKPMSGALGVLTTKGGVCLDQMSLMIALARAGGIKARFRLYAFTASQEMETVFLMDNPILRETYEMLGFLDSLHGCAELYLDGTWLQLDPTFSDYLEAGMGLPVTAYGEEPTWRTRIPERDIVFEGFPVGVRSLLVGMAFLLRDTVDHVNVKMDELREDGREILGDMGREAYNQTKATVKLDVPDIDEVRAFRHRKTVQEIVR